MVQNAKHSVLLTVYLTKLFETGKRNWYIYSNDCNKLTSNNGNDELIT